MNNIQTTLTEKELQLITSALNFWLLKAKQGEVYLHGDEGRAVLRLKRRTQELLEAMRNSL